MSDGYAFRPAFAGIDEIEDEAAALIVKQSKPPAKQVEEKRLLPLNKKPLMLKYMQVCQPQINNIGGCL